MKPKLPPYGKQLIDHRLAGKHPWSVDVYFTEKWVKPEADSPPMIMVPPADYKAGIYDFKLLSGVAADVYVDLSSQSEYLALAVELSKYAAPIFINFISHGEVLRQRELGELLAPSEYAPDYDERADKLLAFYVSQQPPADPHEQNGGSEA